MEHIIEYRDGFVGNFRLLNFATGNYTCTCCICGVRFIGDKRAVQCLACALKAVEENLNNTKDKQPAICAWLKVNCLCGKWGHKGKDICYVCIESNNQQMDT